MAKPRYKGITKFQQVAGLTHGVDEEGLQWIEVPYVGAHGKASEFIAKYPAGATCPIKGFEHLRSRTYPEITQDNGAYSSAILRFEGVHPSESSGEASSASIKYTKELKSISLTDSNNPDKIPANFTYEAPIVVATYKTKSEPNKYRYKKKITDQACPTLIRFEGPDDTTEPRLISSWNPQIVEAPANGIIVCRTHSVIQEKEQVRGEGFWNVTEYHAKFLEAR